MKKMLSKNSVFYTIYCGIGAASLTLIPVSTTYAADTVVEALSGGKVSGQFRYRYEWVDDQTKTKNADASTMRTRLGYMTGDYLDISGFLQFEDVHVVGGNEMYNSTINGRTEYPVVADPEGSEINQAFLMYKGIPGTVIKYGRQAITLDNQRFIGIAEWRQNSQSYDAFTVMNTSLTDTTFFYGHVSGVNRIFGPKSTQGDLDMAGELLNVAYKGWSAGSVVGYGYFLDYMPGQPISNTLSNQTLGLRFDGGYKSQSMSPKFLYTAEFAKQSDYADGAPTVDGDYVNLMFGVDVNDVQLKLNYEVLSGDGVYGFATPLASLYAFNGWADKFLTTPRDGIKDIFLSASAVVLDGINLAGAYHLYTADNIGYDYGSELNLDVAKKINKSLVVTARYATYSADTNVNNMARNATGAAKDLDKFWLMLDVQF